MDRIRKALDLARMDRAKFMDAPIGSAAAEMRQPTATPAAIVYTGTRVFTPSPATLETNRVVNPGSDEPPAAAFRMLRTQVLQRMEERRWRSLAILSANADDGKTTTAINLAMSLANDRRHTVLLVDCDLKRPAVATMLGIEAQFGLNDVLLGRAPIEECLFHPDGFDRLVVLPATRALENSSEALSGPRGREIISELRERYPDRIVLFDLPPILGSDDALAFLPMVECGLVVIAEGATPREDLLRSMELVRQTPLVGTVLNRSTSHSSAYA